jgi:hypothetical protein
MFHGAPPHELLHHSFHPVWMAPAVSGANGASLEGQGKIWLKS